MTARRIDVDLDWLRGFVGERQYPGYDIACRSVPALSVGGARRESLDWRTLDLGAWDVVLVLTAHASYDWAAVVRGARLVIDTRNATGALGPAPANVIRL